MKFSEISSPYSPILHDAREIASYIASISPQYVDEEFIEEYLGRHTCASLHDIPIGRLQPGDLDTNLRNRSKERRYARLDPKTIPPIVVWEDGRIIDGNHRYRVAVRSGLSIIPCYVVSEK